MDGTGRTQAGALGTGAGQFGMMGGFNSPMNTLNNLYAASMLNNLSRQRRPLRMPVTVGIEPTPALIAAAQPANVAQRVQTKLERIPQVRGSGSVSVTMDGKRAVVKGQVKSERDRELIGRMLLLEPGVGDVQNELVVAAPAPAP
jgi:osmotically-inducible protein OsmY